MKDMPILFTPENAQKCHAGTKTQTRRIVKLPLRCPAHGVVLNSIDPRGEHDGDILVNCPYGSVGDRLWVREAWAFPGEEALMYRGNPDDVALYEKWMAGENYPKIKWTPSIHMPKQVCRTWLEITEIRVQRLQEITEEDALAEIGSLETVTQEWVDDCPPGSHAHELATLLLGKQLRAKLSFMNLWESINGAGSWDANPWVWAITFKKVQP